MIRCPAGHYFCGAVESLTSDSTDNHDPDPARPGSRAGHDSLQRGHDGRHGGGGSALRDSPPSQSGKVGARKPLPPTTWATRPACGSLSCARVASPPPPVTCWKPPSAALTQPGTPPPTPPPPPPPPSPAPSPPPARAAQLQQLPLGGARYGHQPPRYTPHLEPRQLRQAGTRYGSLPDQDRRSHDHEPGPHPAGQPRPR